MPGQREDAGGFFVLEVNGGNAGLVKRFSGFALEADVVSEDVARGSAQRKHVTGTRWTPAIATIGIGMGSECVQWIKTAFDQGYAAATGAVTAVDVNLKPISSWTFRDAFVKSLTVPRLDGASKDAVYLDLAFAAEQIQWSVGGSGDVRTRVVSKQKSWLSSNFRVEMGGLPCSRVASVESFTWTCVPVSGDIGTVHEPRHAAKVTVPDIKLSVAMADYAAWAEAAKKWFIDGQRLDENQMQGRIVFLDSDGKGDIGGIDLINCGFKQFVQDDFELTGEKIARFNVELYVEKMGFTLTNTDVRK